MVVRFRSAIAVDPPGLTHKHFAIGLQSACADRVLQALSGIKSKVEAAIHLESSDAASRISVNCRKTAGHDEVAVRLKKQAVDPIIWSGGTVEAFIQGAVGLQARQTGAVLAIRLRKVTREQHPAILLHNQSGNGPIGSGWLERVVGRAVRVEPSQTR